MAKGEDKSYQIFELYNSIDLSLDEKKLKSQIELVKSLMKSYGVNTPTRKQLKKNIASLLSIYSALDRIDAEILQADLDKIQASIEKEFDNFKLLTGITTVKREGKKRKKVLTSLEDLALLNNKEEIDDGTELVGFRTSYNLLEAYRDDMAKKLENKPDFICCKMPLLINAVTPDFIKLPRLGIEVTKSSFGTTWSNQCVMAIKKDIKKDRKELEALMREAVGEKVSLTYDHAMSNGAFPEYNFFWFLPVRVIVELFSLQVHGYAMPFPNVKKSKEQVEVDVKTLREARLKREQEKKCHKETQSQ